VPLARCSAHAFRDEEVTQEWTTENSLPIKALCRLTIPCALPICDDATL
jgi:hypothetical protein